MTTNAYIFSWDITGIDCIVPITQYEKIEVNNTFKILNNEAPEQNPVNGIIKSLVMRAKANAQRHYEIYAIDCAFDIDETEWRKQWEENPQYYADLVRERGIKIYSDRPSRNQVIF